MATIVAAPMGEWARVLQWMLGHMLFRYGLDDALVNGRGWRLAEWTRGLQWMLFPDGMALRWGNVMHADLGDSLVSLHAPRGYINGTVI